MRVEFGAAARGSQKWIQRAVNEGWPSLNAPIAERVGHGQTIEWVSPRVDDAFSEYSDEDFLRKVNRAQLAASLGEFWPTRGPQWDALGTTSKGDVLLVEAKAHVSEICSNGTAASVKSRARITSALEELARELNADPKRAPWEDHFYQLANRLAHLNFLRKQGVSAWLVLANFLGDSELKGPRTREAWDAAYEIVYNVMGLRRDHRLSRFVIHVFPDVSVLAG